MSIIRFTFIDVLDQEAVLRLAYCFTSTRLSNLVAEVLETNLQLRPNNLLHSCVSSRHKRQEVEYKKPVGAYFQQPVDKHRHVTINAKGFCNMPLKRLT